MPTTRHQLSVPGQPTRHYAFTQPLTPKSPPGLIPLLIYLHGQGDTWPGNNAMQFDALSAKHGFSVAYPEGLGDFGGSIREEYIAWNVGLVDRGVAMANTTCYADTQGTCYDSCLSSGDCSACGWSTCHDDVAFISMLIDTAGNNHGTDLRRVYLTGASNGGMMVHHLAHKLVHKITAVAPIYGLPLVGYMALPSRQIPIMQLHDRSDQTIPWEGGVSDGGWIYESLSTVLSAWGRLHRCTTSRKMVGIATPWDGGAANLYCQTSHGCLAVAELPVVEQHARRQPPVIRCFFDGGHGSWPSHIEEVLWWFFEGKERAPDSGTGSGTGSWPPSI